MTGPERQTLSQALDLQRTVLSSVDAFRSEVTALLIDFRREINEAIDKLDERMAQVERSEVARAAETMGVAKFAAHQEIARDKKSTAHREWARVVVAAAGVGATIATIIWSVFEFFKGGLGA